MVLTDDNRRKQAKTIAVENGIQLLDYTTDLAPISEPVFREQVTI
jgi:hypothetical protein